MQLSAKPQSNNIVVAPFMGLLAGFLFNRATGGAIGSFLIFEMVVGALSMVFIALVMANLRKIEQNNAAARAAKEQQLAETKAVRHQQLVSAERARYESERHLRTQLLHTTVRLSELEDQLVESQTQQAVSSESPLLVQLHEATQRIASLEKQSIVADEAASRIHSLEHAQQTLSQQQVDMGLQVNKEAEEVKASLHQLAVTDSQRNRNAAAPDSAQSGRIVQLEARIRRLARELERLSDRQPVAAEDGVESLVKQGGTKDNARVGFLRAMLDANKTLRKQAKKAA